MAEIDLAKKQINIDLVMGFEHEMTNSHSTSRASSLKDLPSFIDKNGSDKEELRVPSQYHPSPTVMDTANLQILMSKPVKVSMMLTKILKAKTKLWQEVTTCLKQIGIPIIDIEPIQTKEKVQRGVKCEPVPINKVGDYCEGEDSNTTLPIEFNEVQSLAILDSEASLAIATKDIWDSWGNPT